LLGHWFFRLSRRLFLGTFGALSCEVFPCVADRILALLPSPGRAFQWPVSPLLVLVCRCRPPVSISPLFNPCDFGLSPRKGHFLFAIMFRFVHVPTLPCFSFPPIATSPAPASICTSPAPYVCFHTQFVRSFDFFPTKKSGNLKRRSLVLSPGPPVFHGSFLKLCLAAMTHEVGGFPPVATKLLTPSNASRVLFFLFPTFSSVYHFAWAPSRSIFPLELSHCFVL